MNILYEEISKELNKMGWDCSVRETNGSRKFKFIYINEIGTSSFIVGNKLCIAQAWFIPPIVFNKELANPDTDIVGDIHQICFILLNETKTLSDQKIRHYKSK